MIRLVDRYWDALEHDFRVHLNGERAMDWVEGRKDWREFYRLKSHLGRGTKYWAARMSDPEIVELLAAQPEQRGRGSGPSFEDWTTQKELAADIIDHLIAIRAAVSHTDPLSVQWAPRPVSPVTALRQQSKQSRLQSSIERAKSNHRRSKGGGV